MKNEPTVSLQMIVKDEVSELIALITAAEPYFDAINLTVSDKTAKNKLAKIASKKLHVLWRQWDNDFAAARNANLKMCDTDYFFWLDADDKFEFSEIPKLVKYAEINNYDAVYLPYNYARDENGAVVALHDRERLLRREAGFTWRGAIHESLLTEGTFRAKKLSAPAVDHYPKDMAKSVERNHQILVDLVEGVDNPDPRYIHYLGLSYFGRKQYEKAIEVLDSYIGVGGWDEEIYRSLLKISECHFMLDNYTEAIEFALKAAGYMPTYPDAYLALARYEYGHEHWNECLQWIEVGLGKKPVDTMSIRNPEMFEVAKLYAAVSQYHLKHYRTAYKYLLAVPERLRGELLETFKQQANLETFITLVPELEPYLGRETIWNALPEHIKYDQRLTKLRYQMIEPKTWPEKSIVVFCGAGYEEWGPHTLAKGMGGSEESVVYLYRELAKLGYDVTVYNSTLADNADPVDINEQERTFIHYKPWRQFDPRDQFENLVIWRAPSYAYGIKAKNMLIDLHDVLEPGDVPDIPGARYMVKSQYHRNLFKHLPDDKFVIVGNGIVSSQFDGEIKKDPHSIGYYSAYYRGAECLLTKIWPKVREQIPDAVCHIAYGWGSWVGIQGEDEFYERMNKIFDYNKDKGLVLHDRLSHEDLAKLMQRTQVWAYPTEFSEIHCITALKAQQALCWPVTTDVAALAETVQSGIKLKTAIMYSDEYQQRKFADEVIAALKEGKTGTPVPGVDWADVAKVWDGVLL